MFDRVTTEAFNGGREVATAVLDILIVAIFYGGPVPFTVSARMPSMHFNSVKECLDTIPAARRLLAEAVASVGSEHKFASVRHSIVWKCDGSVVEVRA